MENPCDCGTSCAKEHKNERKINRVKCQLCALDFRQVEDFQLHQKESHAVTISNDEKNKCERNEKGFGDLKANLKKSYRCESMVKNIGGVAVRGSRYSYPCPCCEESLDTQRSLGLHINAKHNGEHHYACDTCGKKFLTPLRMNDHARKVHVTSRKFLCEPCNKGFKDLHALNRHLKCFHTDERKHTCNVCGSLFKMKYSLQGHLRNIHGVGEQSYDCDVCKKVFMSKLNLDRHKKHVHVDVPKVVGCCEICHKTFASAHNLKNHMEGVHSTERKFKCDICGATFKRKHQVGDHFRNVHTNDRRYPCPYDNCDKAYKKGSHLKSHIKSAHGVECTREIINKAFMKYKQQCVEESKSAKMPEDEGVIVSISDHNAVLITNDEVNPSDGQNVLVLSTNEKSSNSATQDALRAISNFISENQDGQNGIPTEVYIAVQHDPEQRDLSYDVEKNKQITLSQNVPFASAQTLVGSNIMIATVVHVDGK